MRGRVFVQQHRASVCALTRSSAKSSLRTHINIQLMFTLAKEVAFIAVASIIAGWKANPPYFPFYGIKRSSELQVH